MKVGIIGFNNIKVMPYLELYENLLNGNNIEFDVIEWDRNNTMITTKENNICSIHQYCSKNKFFKFIHFLLWRVKVLKILKKEKYDYIIVLTTIPAVLLKDYLIDNYKEKYILDIRDYTYEKYSFYKHMVNELSVKSFTNIISSSGFKKFLNNNLEYNVVHNMPQVFDTYYSLDLKKKTMYTIGYIGVFNYLETNIELCEQLKNDFNFLLYYRGIYLNHNLKKYCTKKNINNVAFEGEFNNNEKMEIYKNIDFINAIYGSDSLLTSTAIPNKFYDALIYHIPILVSNHTHLATLVNKYKIGIVISKGDNIKEKIINFIKNYSQEEFNRHCDNALEICISENQNTLDKISQLFTRI